MARHDGPWWKDLGPTIDYLETRQDIDSAKLGYYGFSSGATYRPVFTAIEPRIKANVLLAGGLVPTSVARRSTSSTSRRAAGPRR